MLAVLRVSKQEIYIYVAMFVDLCHLVGHPQFSQPSVWVKKGLADAISKSSTTPKSESKSFLSESDNLESTPVKLEFYNTAN